MSNPGHVPILNLMPSHIVIHPEMAPINISQEYFVDFMCAQGFV